MKDIVKMAQAQQAAKETATKPATKAPGTRKAPAKRTAKAPAKAAKTTPAAKVKVSAYSIRGGYEQVTHNRAHFSALTVAALVVSGFVALTKNGASKAKGKGDRAFFKRIASPTAGRYWTAIQRMKADEITADGLNAIHDRLTNESNQYKTDMDTIRAFVEGMKKGGPVKVGDTTYKFDKAIS